MPYLIKQDFLPRIQTLNLDQVIGSNYAIIDSWLLTAEAKAISYLTQKYNTEAEFTSTDIWDGSKTYAAGNRVYLDAPVYDPTANYTTGQYTIFTGNFYIASNSSSAVAFAPANWTLIAPQYTIYYGAYPALPYNINTFYNIGDTVYYNGKIYTALQPSATYDQTYLLQIGLPYPPINYAPGTPGYQQWDNGTTYSIPSGTSITSPLWTQADNRSQEMVNVICDIVLYYAHRRISPMNIPALRLDAYHEAINWLRDAGDGKVTPALVQRMPNQGYKIRYGQVKGGAINGY